MLTSSICPGLKSEFSFSYGPITWRASARAEISAHPPGWNFVAITWLVSARAEICNCGEKWDCHLDLLKTQSLSWNFNAITWGFFEFLPGLKVSPCNCNCLVQRCKVQWKSKYFGSAAFISRAFITFSTDEGSTAETFRFTLYFTALNCTVFHVFISISAAQDNYTLLQTQEWVLLSRAFTFSVHFKYVPCACFYDL